jgi:ATP-dependent Lon protease
LEETSAVERLRKALFLLNNEKEVLKLQHKIKNEVEAKMTKQQREYMLKEQLKTIKKELGYEKVKYRKCLLLPPFSDTHTPLE